MAKCIPTTKTCHQILDLIDKYAYQKSWNGGRDMYVHTTFDPTSTHALYGVHKAEVDRYKQRIKDIGGKYIRVVSAQCRDYKIICFALEITPQEALEEKMRKEQEERMQRAYESKLVEIEASILLPNAGATNPDAQKKFARMLLNGDLDPLLPFESYAFIDTPTDKDEQRIYDIINKANRGHPGCVGMVTNNKYKMIELAEQMNKSIKGEDKRMRRRAACLKYGLNFLAKCFEKAS